MDSPNDTFFSGQGSAPLAAPSALAILTARVDALAARVNAYDGKNESDTVPVAEPVDATQEHI